MPLAPVFAQENTGDAEPAGQATSSINTVPENSDSSIPASESGRQNGNVPQGTPGADRGNQGIGNGRNSNEDDTGGDEISALSVSTPSTQGGDIHHEDDLVSLARMISLGTGEFIGDFNYSYPIAIPPGRNGLQPTVNLSYSSNTADLMSPVGYGWSLSTPYIERINREGVENLYNKTYFFSSLDGELASTTSTQYGAKIDNGAFRKYEMATSTTGWTVTDKSGTIYTFGAATSTRMDDPNNEYKVYRWYLEEVRDTNDNYISYSYFKDKGQVYIATSTYAGHDMTDGPFTVEFYHELRNDVASSSEFGFLAGSRYRINEIQATIDGSWVRKYALGYTTGDNGTRSLLNTITETGKDETGTEIVLPAVDFNYQTTNDGWTRNTAWEGTGLPCFFCGGEYLGVISGDINGDGLADFIKYREEDIFGYIYINKGDNAGWYDWEESPFATSSLIVTADTNGKDWGTRLVDVNGDGFGDLLLGQGSTTTAYINNGDNTGWTASTTWTPPYYFVDAGLIDTGLRIAELNGDGLPDLIVSNPTPKSTVYINTGSGWTEDSEWSIPFDFIGPSAEDYGVRVLDVNGDSLGDLVRASNDDAEPNSVYLNTGRKGWVEDTNWTFPEVFIESGGEAYGVRLVDINGDNLVDIIRSDNQPGPATVTKVYLNDGDGTGWTQDANWSIPFQFVDSNGADQGVRLEDVNGDGLADFIQSITDQKRVYLHNGPRADLLTKITHSEGGRTVVSYKPAQQYTSGSTPLNPHAPFVVYTVETIEEHDGVSATTSTMTYEYRGGDFYFNFPRDSRFAGFGTTTATDAAGNVTKTFFHQGNDTDSAKGEYSDDQSKIGKPYRVEVYDNSNNLYQKTINKWENADLGNKRDFAKRTRTADFTYDGDDDHKELAIEFSYDDSNGNVTQKTEWGEVSGSDDGSFSDTGSDKFITAISYAASSTPYILGLPSQETVTDQSATKVKETKYYYDNFALGSVDKGNETKREFWKTGSTYIDTEKAYNSFGLVTSEKDPRDKTTTYTYDARNLYVATSTNPASHVTSYAYDYSGGKPKRTTNPNGFIFETIFDGLDRVTAEKQPDLTAPTTRVTKTSYAYTNTQPPSVQEMHHLDSNVSVFIYKYFDGFDRIVQERKEAEDSWYAARDYTYNNRGQLEKESLPYFSSGTAKTTATSTSDLFTAYTYDALQRSATIANAVGTTVYTYDDWKTTVTDTEGNTKDLTRNAYGRLVQADEYNESTPYSTSYEYNYFGNLTKITDAASNIRNFTYNGLGRRLTAEDLHDTADATYGTWTYDYDDAGNLTSQTDPDSKQVDFTYDDLGRVLTEDFAGSAGTEIAYNYDDCANGTGFLCLATSTDAVTNYAYNALGGTATSTITADNSNYATGFAYDRQGNHTYINYPDDSRVAYTYNTAGLLEQVARKEKADSAYTSVITDFDYSPAGQVAFQRYYNGAETARTYDHTALYRLKHLKTEFPGVGGAGLGEDGGYLIDVPTADALRPPLNLAERVSPLRNTRATERRESKPAEDGLPPPEEPPAEEEHAGEDPVLPEGDAEPLPEDEISGVPSPEETDRDTDETSESKSPTEESNDATPADEELATETPSEEEPPIEQTDETPVVFLEATASAVPRGRAYAAKPERLFVTNATAALLDSIGIPQTREVKVYKNIPLTEEVQHVLEARSWNRITRPLEATVVKRESWNALNTIAEIAPTKFASEFHTKWINYLAEDGWRAIDTAIATSSNGVFFAMRHAPFEAEFPLRSTGTARMINNNRWDVFEDKEITTPPLTMTITAVGINDVAGRVVTGDLYVPAGLRKNTTYVIYENAYPEGDLIYYIDHARAPRLEKLVRINESPAKIGYAFDIAVSGPHAIGRDQKGTPKNIKVSDDRGFGFKPFKIWDSSVRNGEDTTTMQEIEATLEPTGPDSYRLTKLLPQSFFDANPTYPVYTDTTSTFYPDPDAESTSVDGYVWRNNVAEAWDTIHDASAGTGASDSGSGINVNLSTNTTSGQWDRMGRGFILFDTSAITDTDVVSSATFSLDGDGGIDNFNQSGCVVGSTPASNILLSINDYDNIGTTLYADCLDLGSWSTTAYNDFALNATGLAAISQTGITKFGWRLSGDKDNTEPAWASDTSADASPHSADVAGTSVDPKLVVVHAEPNLAPTADTPLTEGLTNPTTISDPTPEFSAVYNDPNAGDLAPWYRIQVSSSSEGLWAYSYWDSGTSTMATTTESNRSPDISYAGSSLASSTTYYWRIRFSDDGGKEGAWSTATSTFKLAASTPTPASEGGIQNLTYSYDNAGNITEIIDASDTDTYKTVTYAYDNLYRLKSATSTNATTTQSDFTRTYSYNAVGAITNKSDVGNYTYAETGYANPHAATDINGAAQTYSNSGNLLSNGTWNYRYNYRGELTKATSTSAVSLMGYDHTGTRVFLKEGTTATTTYAGKYYSTSSATTTKHIFAGGMLVATVEGNDPGVGGAGLGEDPGFFIDLPALKSAQETITLSPEEQQARETRGWNFLTSPLETALDGTPTKLQTEFHNKWINYLSADGWKPIDTTIRETPEAFVMTEAPFAASFPLRSTGTARMDNTNRWNVFTNAEIQSPPVSMAITAEDAADVPGRIVQGDIVVPAGLRQNITYVLYENAYPEGDLIYYIDHARAPRLAKLIRITAAPSQLTYAFGISFSKTHTLRTHAGTVEGIRVSEDRGFGFKPFRIWDSATSNGNQTIEEITASFEQTANSVYLVTKTLPQSFFDKNPAYPVYTDTTSTFYPDPDAESTSVDGYVWRNAVDETWSQIHDASAGTGASDSGSGINVNLSTNTTSGQWDRMGRGFILFDTSAIPDTDEITDATFSIDGDGGLDNFNQSGCVVGSTPASNTSISTNDYDTIGTTLYATCLDLGSWSTTAYNDFSLNATGLAAISQTGITKFGWRLSGDRENVEPTWASDTSADASPHSADVAGTSVDPKLTVTHVPVNQAPTAPTSLQTEGFTNPVDITDPTPEFSAIYNDPDTGDLAPYYRIQVSTSSAGDWPHAYWDSGTSTMTTTTESNRSPELSYAGDTLASSTTYYWRLRFSDDDGKEGAWSIATSTFSLNESETGGTPPELCNCATTTIYYIHTDHLSGTSVITNDSDEVVQVLDYYPFGALRINEQTTNFDERKKFTGYEFDGSTGLNYAGARYQNPEEGRFISQDPVFQNMGVDSRTDKALLDPQMQNSYSYSRNNPLNYVDRDGEVAVGIGGNVSGGVPGIYGQQSAYGVITFSLNPFNLELGLIESTEGGGSTALGQVEGSGGFLFSPNAKSIGDLEGVDVGGGGSAKFGFTFGLDAAVSKPDVNRNRISTFTGSVGLGGAATPYILPVEVHGGASYTKSIGSINVTQSITNTYHAVQDSTRSIYSSLQRQLNNIKSQVNALQSVVEQRLQKSNSN